MVRLPVVPMRSALLLGLALCTAIAGAVALTPKLNYVTHPPSLAAQIPTRFANWIEVPSPYVPVDLAVRRDGGPSMDEPYDETVMRTYKDDKGHQVMLALAYGERQRQEVKVHRPDLCYKAQGYRITSSSKVSFGHLGGVPVDVQGKRMIAVQGKRIEAVTYWMRIGDLYSESAWETRMHILADGLRGRVPDGILVRASSVVDTPEDAAAAFPVVEEFLAELVVATPPDALALLIR